MTVWWGEGAMMHWSEVGLSPFIGRSRPCLHQHTSMMGVPPRDISVTVTWDSSTSLGPSVPMDDRSLLDIDRLGAVGTVFAGTKSLMRAKRFSQLRRSGRGNNYVRIQR